MTDPLSSQRLAEIDEILSREDHDTGQLWRLRNEGLSNADLKSRLRINTGQLGTLKMQLRVLREGFVPSSPSTAQKGAHKVRGWLKREAMSDELRIYLTRLEAVLTAAMAGTLVTPGIERQFGLAAVVEWPTVEWVKVPVDVKTGLPNGSPIAMRHFADCDHWFRNDDGTWIGEPPALASDDQMASLPPCKDCVYKAEQAGNEPVGPRIGVTSAGRSYWWVSQGATFDASIFQRTLWTAPNEHRERPDRLLIKDLRPGDVVFHYATGVMRAVSTVEEAWQPAPRPNGYERKRDGDSDEGWQVKIAITQQDLELPFQRIAELIPNGAPGPLTRDGIPRQLYIAPLGAEAAHALLDAVLVSEPPVASMTVGPLPVLLDLDETDVTATVRIRREQSHLRKHLFAGANEATCALCGRVLPDSLLVAAHIVPRRHLNDAERLDFSSAAMLACALGCDTLFELGYIAVDDTGAVIAVREAEVRDVAEAVAALAGRRITAFSPATAGSFARHRALHS
ncbi:hypothetical protein [Nocardioides pacificus]